MKVMMTKIKPLIREYLFGIKPYLQDIMNNIKISYTWKIQLAITTSFISSENIDEERVIYTKRDNIEITNHEKADKVIQKILEFHFFRYQADIFFLDCFFFFFFHFYCLNTLSPIFFPV